MPKTDKRPVGRPKGSGLFGVPTIPMRIPASMKNDFMIFRQYMAKLAREGKPLTPALIDIINYRWLDSSLQPKKHPIDNK